MINGFSCTNTLSNIVADVEFLYKNLIVSELYDKKNYFSAGNNDVAILKMRTTIYLTIIFLIIFVDGFGQNYVLEKTHVRDKNNTYLLTSAPFIDKDNFVWYSTNREGDFYRFDGKNKLRYHFFKNQNKNYSNYFTTNTSWTRDNNNNLWIAEPDKVYIVKPNTFVVERIEYVTESIELNSSIAIDKSNNIWISNGSRYLIKIGPNRRVEKIGHPLLKKIGIQIVKVLDNGRIIAKSGLNLFYIDEKGLHFFCDLRSKEINSNCLFIENGKILAKNTSGIYKYNGTPFRYVYIKELDIQVLNNPDVIKNRISGSNDDGNSNFLYTGYALFIANNNNLFINKVDKEENTITTTDTLNFKSKIEINYNKGDANLIWISTYDELYKLLITPDKFTKILQFPDKELSTRGILSDLKGNLYIGTYQGLFRLEKGKKKPKEFVIDGKKKAGYDMLFLEKNDSILWTVETNSIKRINLKNNKIKIIKLPHGVGCIKEKSPDEFWLGTGEGLYVFNKKSGSMSPYKIGKKTMGLIFDLLQTKNGNMWAATREGLFFKGKDNVFINYSSVNKSFSYKNIIVLEEDSNGNLWIGSDGDGVIFLDTKTNRIKNYTQSDGLSHPIVCGILESRDAMWFATYYGLSRFDKKKQLFSVYYKEDGLPENEFNLRSAYKKNDSTYYFGGLNGIIEFNPKKIQYERSHPRKIFLFSSRYFSTKDNKDMTYYLDSSQKEIILPYNKNYFSAKFSINELFYNEKNIYFYKIDGLTNGWIDAGTTGSVELFGLPAGEYVLQIKGKDVKGAMTVNEIKISICVKQIFFKTPFFIGLAVLVVIVLIIYLFIRRYKKQNRIFEREKEIINLKASALKSQMNPHFVFNILNKMQSALILKGEKEVNAYFVAFAKLLRLTLNMSRQDLVSLKDEIEYIENYLILNKLQLNNDLHYSIVVEESIHSFSEIFLPGMLVQPFVENAIIHGFSTKNNNRLEIRCRIENTYLIISVEDNGIGRAAAATLSRNEEEPHKSWATSIVNERIRIANDVRKDAILLEIIDLEKNGKASGTRVVLKFKLGANKDI